MAVLGFMRSRIVPFCAAVVLLGLGLGMAQAGAAGKPKKKKGTALPPQVALSNTLNEKRDAIQDCAVKEALERGAQSAHITTKVTINSRGQVVDSRVEVKLQGGEAHAPGVRTCVEQVLKQIKFPRSDAPLIQIERTWNVSTN